MIKDNAIKVVSYDVQPFFIVKSEGYIRVIMAPLTKDQYENINLNKPFEFNDIYINTSNGIFAAEPHEITEDSLKDFSNEARIPLNYDPITMTAPTYVSTLDHTKSYTKFTEATRRQLFDYALSRIGSPKYFILFRIHQHLLQESAMYKEYLNKIVEAHEKNTVSVG